MELTINSFPVNFQLEKEKTVSDIIYSVSQWASERQLVFTQVYIDDEMYLISEVPEREVGDVSTINCVIQSKADLVFTIVDEGAAYCSRIQSFIQKSDDKGVVDSGDIRQLSQGLEWLMEVLHKVLTLLGIAADELKIRDRTVQQYIEELESFQVELSEKEDAPVVSMVSNKAPFFTELKDVFRFLLRSEEMSRLIIQSTDSPDVIIQSINTIKNELKDQLENIETTAVAFQTGRDNEGSQGLERFIDFIYRYTRMCYQVGPVLAIDTSAIAVNDVSLEEKNNELQDYLIETITILENNDIISLADILEYEILPALSDIGEYIDMLAGSIKGGGA